MIARIIDLKVMAAIMDPGRDWSWIYRFASSMRVRYKLARLKRHRFVHIERLLYLGLDLMEKANDETTELRKFKTYRDGLMIGLLASRQLRLRNLAGLTLDRTLVPRGDGWWIQILAAETKTNNAIEFPWPEILVSCLDTYLTDHRSVIADLRGTGTGSDALWLSMYGSPMTENGIYAASLPACAKDWDRRLIRIYFGIAPPPASQSTTRCMSGLRLSCSAIAPDRPQSAIAKRAASKRATFYRTTLWRSVAIV